MYCLFGVVYLLFCVSYFSIEGISTDSHFLVRNRVESENFQLQSEGFTRLFWDYVEQNVSTDKLVSKVCWNQLRTVASKNNATNHQLLKCKNF